MPSLKNLSCWQIMNCSCDCKCKLEANKDRNCWEIAKEVGGYRNDYDICVDCIVYMVKNGSITLSAHEINEARASVHSVCVLAASCG